MKLHKGDADMRFCGLAIPSDMNQDGSMESGSPAEAHPTAIRRKAILALAIGIFALVLLSLAWPRFKASYHYLPVDTAISNYFETREIPSAQLKGLITQAQQALDMHDHYRYWEGLSVLYYLRALDENTPYWEKRPELRRSLRAIEETVRRAPAIPRVWLRMARVQAWLRAPEQYVLTPLRMSILTGRVEPSLLVARLELGYRYLDRLDSETATLLRDQTVLAWRVDRHGVVLALREGRLAFTGIAALLAGGNADLLEEMEAQLGGGV